MPSSRGLPDVDRWPERLAALLEADGVQPADDLLCGAADLGRALAFSQVSLEEVAVVPLALLEERLRSGEKRPGGTVTAMALITRQLMNGYAAATHESTMHTEALRREKDRAQLYLDIAGVMIVALDARGNMTLVNKRACALLGCNEEDLIGRSWFDLFVPERVRDRVKTTFGMLIGGELELTEYYENPVLTRAGEERLIAWHNALLRDESGNITGTLSSGEDITNRKQAENELHRSHKRLGGLVEQRTRELVEVNARLQEELDFTKRVVTRVPAIICRIAPDGTTSFVNPAGERITGYRAEELIGRSWWQVFYPGDEYGQVERVQQVLRQGDVRDYEMVLTTRTGEKRTISWNSINRFDVDGRPVEIIGFGNDITARKQAEEALRYSNEYLNRIINSITDPIFVKDRQHRLVLVNDAECALTGHPRVEVLGKTDYEFFPREQVDVFWEKDEAVFETGRENINEEVITDPRGTTRTIVTKKTLYTDPLGNKFLVGVIRDITERKRAEEMARMHQAQLAHADRVSLLGEMASGLAHEMAQPLSAMLYYARGCLAHLEAGTGGTPEARETLQKIAAQAERAGQFIHRLKAFVRRAPAGRVPADINTIVRNVFELSSPGARSKRVAIRLELTNGLRPVIVDEVQIEQVLLNLVNNGIDAISETGADPQEVVIQTCAGPGERVRVAVEDTGPGVPPGTEQQIFDPFFTTKPSGTGLGLPISRSILEAHGGELWVEAGAGRGARFLFSLPWAPDESHVSM